MRGSLLSLASLLLAPALCAEPLNYSYGYLRSGEWHVDGRSFRNDIAGVYIEAGKHVHLFGSLGKGGAYAAPTLQDARTLRLGIGGHWLLGQDSMIAVEAAAIRASYRWHDAGRMAHLGWSAIVEYRYRFAPAWEAIVTGTRTQLWNWRTQEFAVGPVWHLNDTVAIGAFYRRMDGNSGFDATIRTYF